MALCLETLQCIVTSANTDMARDIWSLVTSANTDMARDIWSSVTSANTDMARDIWLIRASKEVGKLTPANIKRIVDQDEETDTCKH